MRLTREPHHDGRNLQVLQGAEHLLASRGRRRPQVALTLDQHQRRLYLRYVSDRGTCLVIRLALPWGATEPVRSELREIGCVPEAAPVRDGPHRNGRFEARGL